MFKVNENFRDKKGPFKSTKEHGNNGVFIIPRSSRTKIICIVSDGMGWEHVSVNCRSDDTSRMPTWNEMCFIKDLFWDEEDCVIQYHPAKTEYVNNHKHVLHLWRPINEPFPIPHKFMVGFKTD